MFGKANPRSGEEKTAKKGKRLGLKGFLIIATFCVLFCAASYEFKLNREEEKNFAPPNLPVELKVTYFVEDQVLGDKDMVCSGRAQYTFRNTWHFPVTLAFPPLCYYTYSKTSESTCIPPIYNSTTETTWQTAPFPDCSDKLRECFKDKREVIIPPGESVSFEDDFNLITHRKRSSRSYCAFVFGPPEEKCEHPVLGTVYGPIKFEMALKEEDQ